MKLTLNFTELNKKDTDIAGGKGASLGEMTQAGIPVPPGFVILSTTFDEFIRDTDLIQEIDKILDEVNHKDINSVEVASEKIQTLIKRAKMPENISKEIINEFKKLDTEFVAVRSSATAEDGAENAWAGQLDSYLNTKEVNLLEKVQHCWASLFTPRAIFYRFEKGLHKTKISVAVVVQKMVNSEIAGIAFSVHPVTEDRNQMIIEAGFGLGEAIVSGQITPNSYVVEKEPRRIIDINVSTQDRGLYRVKTGGNEWINISEPKASSQVLAEKQILEFANIIMKIENHYGFPCDIEWAYEKGKFYIVQSRPITTLRNINETNNSKNKAIVFEKSITRDWAVLNAEIWHKIYTDEFFKQFKWKYTDVVFEGKENTVTVFRAPEEHIDGMRDFIIKHLEKDKNWILKQANIVEKNTSSLIKWLNNLKSKNLAELNSKELKNIIENLFIENIFIGPRFLIMMWFPMQMENHGRKIEFNKAIDRAIESRNKTEGVVPLSDEVIRKILAEVSKRINLIDDNLSKYITYKEFLSVLKGDKIDEDLLIKRKDYFIICNDGVLNVPLKNYIHNKGYVLKEEKIEGITEIKGSSAYPGFVKGKVRVIISKEKLNEIQDGEILVTAMTTPEFVPTLKKVSGFITDEGGITCHAAIVAREMKKPCVIGTKNATKVLKDGNIVEVDANNGIVKIIK